MRGRACGSGGCSRVRGDDHVGARVGDVGDLPAAELSGHLRLDQIEDAGAAAADLGVGKRDEREAGNRLEQLTRLAADALRVRQVTGVVIGDAQRERMPRAPAPAAGSSSASLTSRTFAANARARSAQAGSSRRSSP